MAGACGAALGRRRGGRGGHAGRRRRRVTPSTGAGGPEGGSVGGTPGVVGAAGRTGAGATRGGGEAAAARAAPRRRGRGGAAAAAASGCRAGRAARPGPASDRWAARAAALARLGASGSPCGGVAVCSRRDRAAVLVVLRDRRTRGRTDAAAGGVDLLLHLVELGLRLLGELLGLIEEPHAATVARNRPSETRQRLRAKRSSRPRDRRLASRSSTSVSLNCRGPSEASATSSQSTGIATGAPGSARTAYGATIVCP